MPNEPSNILDSSPAEGVVLPAAVAKIVDKTHAGALKELDQFISDQTNPFFVFGEFARSILGEPNPEVFSRMITYKRRAHDQYAHAAADDYNKQEIVNQEKGKETKIIPLNTMKSSRQISAVADDYNEQEMPKAA